MPLLIITSPWGDTGKTSLAVNLAFGLLGEGKQVALLDLGIAPGVLREWIDRISHNTDGVDIWDAESDKVETSVDKVRRQVRDTLDGSPERWIIADLDGRRRELVDGLGSIADCLLVTIPLRDLGIEELLAFQEGIKAIRKGRGIDLVVATRINSHSWAENEPGMMQLIEHFNEENIADPLPT